MLCWAIPDHPTPCTALLHQCHSGCGCSLLERGRLTALGVRCVAASLAPAASTRSILKELTGLPGAALKSSAGGSMPKAAVPVLSSLQDLILQLDLPGVPTEPPGSAHPWSKAVLWSPKQRQAISLQCTAPHVLSASECLDARSWCCRASPLFPIQGSVDEAIPGGGSVGAGPHDDVACIQRHNLLHSQTRVRRMHRPGLTRPAEAVGQCSDVVLRYTSLQWPAAGQAWKGSSVQHTASSMHVVHKLACHSTRVT